MWSRLVVVKKFTMIKPSRQLLMHYHNINRKALQLQLIIIALVVFDVVVYGVPVTVTVATETFNAVRATRCYIPGNKDNGTCLEASRCPPYIRLKTLSDVTLDTSLEYLTSVHCENETNVSEPLVCCPSDTNQDYEQFQLPERKQKKQKRRINVVTESGLVSGECGKQVTNRIYGGEIAELDEYPWMALLVYNTSKYFFIFIFGSMFVDERFF